MTSAASRRLVPTSLVTSVVAVVSSAAAVLLSGLALIVLALVVIALPALVRVSLGFVLVLLGLVPLLSTFPFLPLLVVLVTAAGGVSTGVSSVDVLMI